MTNETRLAAPRSAEEAQERIDRANAFIDHEALPMIVDEIPSATMVHIESAELERLRKIERSATIIYAQINGIGPFITGASENGEWGLPETVTICPIFGSDVTGIYKLVKAGAPEW